MSESSPSYPSLLPECDLKNSSGALYLQCETIHPGKFLPDPEGQKAPETGKLCLDHPSSQSYAFSSGHVWM